MNDEEARLRSSMVEAMQALDARGLNRGTSGNVSVRLDDGILVTPSGVPPARLTPESMVKVLAGGVVAPEQLKPSSEWRMHWRLLERRPDAGAVVHCHSRHATILACAGLAIPPVHYMVGVAGTASVPLAPYAVFGSEALADGVVDVLGSGRAALMANHGQVTVAPRLAQAVLIAEEIEEQAAIYWGTLAVGGPRLLTEDQMADVLERFGGYGQKTR
ncbi:class II aldolase/adducin family protein [Phenylobacterium kunshanense]|uniref:Class II aldolase n=1 Tax=Phenylobacterium kunshanense TaxID=1445034 RepID=A0A328BPC6_9CAUL|nr:class II aldolase/adducin family protein [Phenylobacterium kunshanense]RAK68897.1 class II aldolase [Phenylobacterium kunshanense]